MEFDTAQNKANAEFTVAEPVEHLKEVVNVMPELSPKSTTPGVLRPDIATFIAPGLDMFGFPIQGPMSSA